MNDGTKLNPYFEIYRELGIDVDDWCRDYRGRLASLVERRRELLPFLGHVKTNGNPLTAHALRDAFRHLFAFAVPTPAAIKAIAALGSVVEIGAGSGYWASLIAGAGAPVTAVDNGSWKIKPLWYRVRRGGGASAGRVDAAALFLCWPPYQTGMAWRAIRAFRGDLLAYVGEDEEGCTGCSRFHSEIANHWSLQDRAPVARWPGLHDSLKIYRRAK